MSFLTPYDYTLLEKVITLKEYDKEKIDLNEYFGNKKPIVIEIGCGNGHFLIEKAKEDSSKNFLGIDLKKNRITRCREKEEKYGVDNVRWIIGDALPLFDKYLYNKTISSIYMFFPDPWPKKRHHKRRLFQKEFLTILNRILTDDAIFYFVTDYKEYYEWCQEITNESEYFNFHKLESENEEYIISVFGQRWKREGRDFYPFLLKRK
jgi:tRNA (guanine-N7-)-methyltransferase